jgi:hypothetical protein
MSDGAEVYELVPVEAVTRALYVVANLDKIQEFVRKGDQIWANLPRGVRDNLVCGECGEDELGAHSSAKVSMALSQLTPQVRSELGRMVEEVRSYVEIQAGFEDGFFGTLDEDMVKVITEMITFVQTLGARSVRNLLHSLESANAGDWSYVLVQMHGRDSEINSRRSLSPETKREFGL